MVQEFYSGRAASAGRGKLDTPWEETNKSYRFFLISGMEETTLHGIGLEF